MAVKSVIEIDIQDSAFKKFAASFKEYEDRLSKTPGIWSGVGKQAEQSGISFKKLTAALLAQAEFSHHITVEHGKANIAVEKQAHLWSGMARSSKSFAAHITEATRSLLRWSTLTGVVSGLLGAGGLFGIERLAQTAGAGRRAALGLGTTYGERSAFDVNFGRVVSSDSFLGGVNEALHDVTKRVGLYGAGLTEADLRGRDTAQVSAELLPALKRIADATPDAMLAQVLRARHLDQFLSLEDFQRLKATPEGEFANYGRQFQSDIRSLNLTRSQQKAWQDLQVQMTRAGETIETSFIRGLTPLAPELTNLSSAFTKFVGDLLASPQIKVWIQDLASGIKSLGDYLLSDKFKADTQAFIKGVEEFAAAVGRAAQWIEGIIPGGKPDPQAQKDAATPGTDTYRTEHSGSAGWGFTPGLGWHWTPGAANTPAPGRDPEGDARRELQRRGMTGSANVPVWYKPWTWRIEPAATKAAFRTTESQYNLPAGLLTAVDQA